VHHYLLTREQILENLKLFLSVNLEERKKIKGLHEKRANVIIGGSLVLLTIMKVLKRDKILVSEDDILEGMMEEE
jgi:exopolyphosphatase/guanosine-5'-triphosphate,3'-diphosphate pyrophosphatase